MTPVLANIMNPTTLLLVLAVVVLLFGSAKIPQLMRGLGSGVNEFKKGLADGAGDEATPAGKPIPPADTTPKA